MGVRLAAVAAFILIGAPSGAHAGDLDFRLNNGRVLVLGDEVTGFSPNNARFRDFATQLAFVLAPRMASPAETLGHAGFHLSAMWSGSSVSENEPYWLVTERGNREATGPGLVQTLQLDVRKGLPLSFEVGANFMWLAQSEIFAPGVEVRWALQEGFQYIPDISLRAAVNHMVGNRDMRLTVIGADAMLSKSFGIGGMINLAPYIGWSLIFVNASTRVIDPTPADQGDSLNDFVFRSLRATDNINHRLTTGLRLLYHVVNISVQGEFQMFSDYETGGNGVMTVTTKLGLDY